MDYDFDVNHFFPIIKKLLPKTFLYRDSNLLHLIYVMGSYHQTEIQFENNY